MGTGTPIIVYSGCRWTDSGGAQRPVAFVQELRRRGVEALYCGVEDDLPYIPDRPGVAVFAWSAHFEKARRLIDAGWRVIYDYIDDWSGFESGGDLPEDRGLFDSEWELIEQADLIVGSSPQLVERALSWGKRAELIENAGPNLYWPKSLTGRRKVGGPTLAVYAGHMLGSWFDWSAIEALSRNPGNTTLLIGLFQMWGWDGVPIDVCASHPLRRTRWLGQLEHEHCLGVIGGCDVGLIPFKGSLSHYVDPIKYYDYLSRGLWSVATPELWPLYEKPYVIMVEPADFPMAVIEAAERTYREPPDPAYYYANTWAQRVDRLLELVAELESHPMKGRKGRARGEADPHKIHPRPLPKPEVLTRDRIARGEAIAEEDCKIRVSVQIPGGQCSMVPAHGRCPYCSEAEHVETLAPIQGTVSQWVNGLKRIGRKWGPAYFNFCFGEPLGSEECIRIVGAVARENRVDVVTNALAPAEVLAGWPRNGNIGINMSWHPHAWKSISEFMARRLEYEASGFYVGAVGVVAYPPYLKKLHGWDVEFTKRGVEDMVALPFWGEWCGFRFPDSYTPGERELLKQYSERSYLGDTPVRTWDCPAGLACATGRDYAFVCYDGSVQRCSVVSEPKMGNILDRSVSLFDERVPCSSNVCPCPDLWKYIDDGKQVKSSGRRRMVAEGEQEPSVKVEIVTSGRRDHAT